MYLLFIILILFNNNVFSTNIIQEKPKIIIKGVEKALLDNVKAHLSLSQSNCNISEKDLTSVEKKAEKEIQTALQAMGYYQAESITTVVKTETCFQAEVKITKNKPILIQSITLTLTGAAEKDEEFQNIINEIDFKVGDILHQGKYSSFKKKIQDFALEQGYFDGQWVSKIIALSEKNYSADITLHYDSGSRYKYEAIRFKQDYFHEKFLNRFIDKNHQFYSAQDLRELQENLSNTNYFSTVSYNQTLTPDKTVVIDVTLDLKRRHVFEMGVGYSTDIGVRTSFSYENRRVNRWGDSFNTYLNLSIPKIEFQVHYNQPLENPVYERRSFQLGYLYSDIDDIRTKTVVLGMQYIKKYGNWLITPYIQAQYEDSDIKNDKISAFLLKPGVNFLYSKANHKLYPTYANRFEFDISGASKTLLSDVNVIHLLAKTKLIRPLGSGRVLLRGEVGSNLGKDFNELPVSLRFFAGGDQSIRGYAYQHLTNTKTMMVLSAEYEHIIYKKWYGAVFYDMGEAFENLDNPKQSAGVGLRWRSPIGPVRLDLAFPLQDDTADNFRIHLYLGYDL